MRRWVNVLAMSATLSATLLAGTGGLATAAHAAPNGQRAPSQAPTGAAPNAAAAGDSGWVAVPVPPFEKAAGTLCDFAVKGDPIVADLHKRTLTTNPDGTVRSELWVGPLVYRVTDEATGARTTLNSSASGVVVHHADGSLEWFLHGPLGVAVGAGLGNLGRGLWQVDGAAYTEKVSATGYKTIDLRHVTATNVCSQLG